MGAHHHRHRGVSEWIHLFDDADDRDTMLQSCPRAREAWADGLDVWLRHVVTCSVCRELARAQELFADEGLDCPTCRDNLELVYQLLGETEHYEPATVLELERAELLLDEIVDEPLTEQMQLALTEPFYQQWGFVQRLLVDARAHWRRDPEIALDRSLLAVVAVDQLNPESYGELWIADLAAKAHAYVANAHRILGHFAEAETEFALAEQSLRRGVGSGLAEARVYSLKASLLNDQLRHREALALLGEVERFYQEHGESHEAGRLALTSAHVLYCLGQPQRAAEECARAFTALDADREPTLPLIARHNAIEYLLCAGELDRARSLFDELPSMPEPLEEIRRLWLEANLLRAEQRFGEARAVYERVRTGFAEADLHYDAALATLDLAVTAHQESGHLGDVRHMVEQATIQLTLAQAKPEAFAALRLLLRSARNEALTLAVLDRVRRRLETLRPS